LSATELDVALLVPVDRRLKALQKEPEAEWDKDDPADQEDSTGSSGYDARNAETGAANQPAQPPPAAAPDPPEG
jgi:hypothetical protein